MRRIIDNEIYVDRKESAKLIKSTPGTMAVWDHYGLKGFNPIMVERKRWYKLSLLNAYVTKDLSRQR